jgi:molybdopterin/thiamine biosynthesis adenylyltransferase
VGKGPKVTRGHFVRAVYAGRNDIALRVPELHPLRQKTVALFGTGSLGAPAVLELARCGLGTLRFLDHDVIDGGPTVRWPFGIREVGRKKVEVLRKFILQEYPYTVPLAIDHELGAPAAPRRRSDQDVITEMVVGADLVFDATANLNVQLMLASLSRQCGIPYLMVEGRYGGWGGVVFRQSPDPQTACVYCLLHALQPEGGIADAPAGPLVGVQPHGCGDPTFTGTGFDMSTIALDAVRRAVGMLCGGTCPDPPGNVAVISLRNEDGSPSAPRWDTHDLKRHPKCHCGPAGA